MRLTQAHGRCHPPPRTSPVRVEIFLFSPRCSAGARRGSAIPLGPQRSGERPGAPGPRQAANGTGRGGGTPRPGGPSSRPLGFPGPPATHPQGPSSTFLSRSIKALLLPLESRLCKCDPCTSTLSISPVLARNASLLGSILDLLNQKLEEGPETCVSKPSR